MWQNRNKMKADFHLSSFSLCRRTSRCHHLHLEDSLAEILIVPLFIYLLSNLSRSSHFFLCSHLPTEDILKEVLYPIRPNLNAPQARFSMYKDALRTAARANVPRHIPYLLSELGEIAASSPREVAELKGELMVRGKRKRNENVNGGRRKKNRECKPMERERKETE